jgi:arabinose-5-phosphate isomerase
MHPPTVQQLDVSQDEELAQEGRRLLTEESAAIARLCARLDTARFAEAVRLLAGCRGHVVVTGMGKSGAVGRKFAGTLSSTGTPALFLHPAEALHGDLGVLGGDDVVVVLSNSGETDELVAILPAIRRLETPIVGFTASEKSTIGRACAVVLDVAVEREACPLNLAPTTSTTVMLALSDALAITVMQAKQFTSGDYALRHPAGSLGRRLLLRVRDVMRCGDDLAMVSQEVALIDAMLAVSRAHAGAAIVVDERGLLAGLLTDGDFRRYLLANQHGFSDPVERAMNKTPGTVSPEILAAEGLTELERFHPNPMESVGEAPVVDDLGKPVGMLTMKDLVRAGIATTL